MFTVVYHDDLKEVQGDAELAAWLSAPRAAVPFERKEWFELLASHCGMTPLLAVARGDTALVALPLMREGQHLRSMANWYTFRYAPIGTDQEALTVLCRDLARQTSRLSFSPLPDEKGESTGLAKALRDSGWSTFIEQCDVNHVLEVGGRSFAEYLASRPGQLRTTLKRKAGKVSVELADAFSAALWADYEAVYAESWKPSEGSPEFLRAFAEQEGRAGRLRMAIARVDGVPVAAQFWTVEDGTAFIHKLAHTEASKPLSPGTTLSAALFERVIDRDGVSLVDFGTGNDAYKCDWMEQIRPRFRIEAYRPSDPRNWLPIAKARLRTMRQRG